MGTPPRTGVGQDINLNFFECPWGEIDWRFSDLIESLEGIKSSLTINEWVRTQDVLNRLVNFHHPYLNSPKINSFLMDNQPKKSISGDYVTDMRLFILLSIYLDKENFIKILQKMTKGI